MSSWRARAFRGMAARIAWRSGESRFTSSSPIQKTARTMTLHVSQSAWPVTPKRPMATGARAPATSWTPIQTTIPTNATSAGSAVAPLRRAMRAPNPTKMPAISASERNISTSCMSRHPHAP